MTYNRRLRKALIKRLGAKKVVFMKGWRKNYTGPWLGKNRLPVALVLHHTAGAATDSTNPKAPGNQKGANAGIVNFIQNHYRVPAANFTLDRDGTVYVHAAQPIWHAGLGTFAGKKPWNTLGIPQDMGNRYMLGVEIMSKGVKKDFTAAQKQNLVDLILACQEACKWQATATRRLPRHRDWTTRKNDIVYSNAEVQKWIKTYK